MNNYYLLMHFDGKFVTGMLALNQESPEVARKSCIRSLTITINKLRIKYPKDDYKHVNRHIAFRKVLSKPWRYHKDFYRSSPNLEIMELPKEFNSSVFHVGYWMGLYDHDEHLCNVPRNKEEHPVGYVVSRIEI